jgi:hypothetical protein
VGRTGTFKALCHGTPSPAQRNRTVFSCHHGVSRRARFCAVDVPVPTLHFSKQCQVRGRLWHAKAAASAATGNALLFESSTPCSAMVFCSSALVHVSGLMRGQAGAVERPRLAQRASCFLDAPPNESRSICRPAADPVPDGAWLEERTGTTRPELGGGVLHRRALDSRGTRCGRAGM